MNEENRRGKVVGGVFVYDPQYVKDLEELLVQSVVKGVTVVLCPEEAEAILRELTSLRSYNALKERQSEFERGVRYAREAYMCADRVCFDGNQR